MEHMYNSQSLQQRYITLPENKLVYNAVDIIDYAQITKL